MPGRTELASILARLESWSRPWRSRYGWTLRPLALAVAIRLLVFAAGVAGTQLIGIVNSKPFPGMLQIWLRKDGGWYIRIASRGYNSPPRGLLTANFFPLYPLSISTVQHVTGLFLGASSYAVAGIVVSWTMFLVACVLLFRLAADRFGEQVAYLSVLLLGIFPFSYYFGATYTESLYLVCALVAFLGIERGNWWLAGTGALFAGATRPTGLIVGLAVVVAYLLDWIRTRHHLRWDLLALALTPLGVVGFAFYSWLEFGDPLAYMVAARLGWGEHLQIGALVLAIKTLMHPHNWVHGSVQNLIYSLVDLVVLIACYPIYRLLGASYAVFTFLSGVAPLVEFGLVKGDGRYASVLFPAFIVLAYALRNRPILCDMLIIGSTLLLAVCVTGFAGGYGFS